MTLANLFTPYKSLISLCIIFLAQYLVRIVLTGSIRYGFLGWNIILAILPILFINLAVRSGKLKYFWLLLWFIFFPNSAYLFTDIKHFYQVTTPAVSFWYDNMIFINITLIGFVTSFLSLNQFLCGFITPKLHLIISALIWLIASVAIYIGRVWRLNSWDILDLPMEITQQQININDLWPYLTIWPVCLTVWFWLWSHHAFDNKNTNMS